MDNKFIPKKVWITRPPSPKNRRDPTPQKEPSYWLMKYVKVVTAGVFENHINSAHTSSTLFID